MQQPHHLSVGSCDGGTSFIAQKVICPGVKIKFIWLRLNRFAKRVPLLDMKTLGSLVSLLCDVDLWKLFYPRFADALLLLVKYFQAVTDTLEDLIIVIRVLEYSTWIRAAKSLSNSFGKVDLYLVILTQGSTLKGVHIEVEARNAEHQQVGSDTPVLAQTR